MQKINKIIRLIILILSIPYMFVYSFTVVSILDKFYYSDIFLYASYVIMLGNIYFLFKNKKYNMYYSVLNLVLSMIIFSRYYILKIMIFYRPYISKYIRLKDLDVLSLDINFSVFICLYTILNYFFYKKRSIK